MRNFSAFEPATDDPIAFALAQLNDAGLAAVPDLFATMAIAADDSRLQPLLIETVFLLLGAFEGDPARDGAYACLDALTPDQAAVAGDLLLMANAPDGQCDTDALPDATLRALAALIARAGATADALALLREATAKRQVPRFLSGVYQDRCHILGLSPDVAAIWTGIAPQRLSIDEAWNRIDIRPLDLDGHRALARGLAEEGQWEAAVHAFAVGLALPIGAADKAELVADFALFAAYLRSHGEIAALGGHRVVLALSACPDAALQAETVLAALASDQAPRAFDPDALADMRGFFHGFGERSLPAYPYARGKPKIDTVWLEITNYCNQKCTFCPDMHREDSRTWLPLADIKRLIDELTDTVHVGSMQLNAYGEPLLHPNIADILAYIREKGLAFPTYFTSHGMTLVEKKLAQLSHNYPQGIAISLHNDNQQSYEATRSTKIGDYETLVTRVSALLEQMVMEEAACHLRLYQMVSNGQEDQQVDPKVRGAFPGTVERMTDHVRKWEKIAADIATKARAAGIEAEAVINTPEHIAACFIGASHGDGFHLPVLRWRSHKGSIEQTFMSPRPVGTYANLLLEYHPDWEVERKLVSRNTCGYFAANPSLAIFATGRLGICCLDMNSTATFGALSDYADIAAAVTSPEATRMFAQLANGVAVSRGCQICLGSGKQLCRS